MASGALEGDIDISPDQQRRATVAGRGRPDAGFSPPHRRQLLELALENLPASVKIDAACGKVVLAPSWGNPEREASSAQGIQCRGLLREQGSVRAQGRDQDVGRQADPFRHGRRGCQRQQRLIARIYQPIDRPEGGETSLLGPAGPLDDARALNPQHRVWKPDSDIHPLLLSCLAGFSARRRRNVFLVDSGSSYG